jgi:hypothetical protein
VNKIVIEAYNANLMDLSRHKDALLAAADAILDQEMLTGALGRAALGEVGVVGAVV